jgi:hypothetical protein
MTSTLPLWVSDMFFALGVACLVCSLLLIFGVWWSGRCEARDRAHWERVHTQWRSGLDQEPRT